MKLPDAALKFLRAARIERLGLIRCGFELETQATEGNTWSGSGSSDEFDEDGFEEAVSERMSEIIGSELHDYVGSDLLERVESRVRTNLVEGDEIDRSRFEAEGETPDEWLRNNHSIPSELDVVSDGSVSGFEFRTKRGGVTYPQFIKAAKGIFDLSHTIDVGCSFHVHLSVFGVKHTYGQRLQQSMVEYLVENADRAPATVRARWFAARNNQYIKKLIGNSDEKYCFVRMHTQGTWEFRCFGNVQNAADARVCLDLAIAAMMHGYRVLIGEAYLLADSATSTATWVDAVFTALETGKKLSSLVSDPATVSA